MDITSNFVIYRADIFACLRQLVITRLVSNFHLRLKPCSRMSAKTLFSFISTTIECTRSQKCGPLNGYPPPGTFLSITGKFPPRKNPKYRKTFPLENSSPRKTLPRWDIFLSLYEQWVKIWKKKQFFVFLAVCRLNQTSEGKDVYRSEQKTLRYKPRTTRFGSP